jgi:hypothetical protein
MNEETELQLCIIKSLDEKISAADSFELFKQKLRDYLNDLINHDFQKLIFVLYKVDVNERKLKRVLSAANADAASVLADLIIARQVEKMNSRKAFKPTDDFSEEEKW